MASVQAPFGYKYRSRQDDDEACPPDACAFGESQKPLRQVHKVRTDRAGLAAGKIRLHPSMQADWIKPAAGACSLGQDAALKIGNWFPCPFLLPIWSLKGKSS